MKKQCQESSIITCSTRLIGTSFFVMVLLIAVRLR